MSPPRDQQSERTIAIRRLAHELLDAAEDPEDTHVTVQVTVDGTGRHQALPVDPVPSVARAPIAALRAAVDALSPPAWARGAVLLLLAGAAVYWAALGW